MSSQQRRPLSLLLPDARDSFNSSPSLLLVPPASNSNLQLEFADNAGIAIVTVHPLNRNAFSQELRERMVDVSIFLPHRLYWLIPLTSSFLDSVFLLASRAGYYGRHDLGFPGFPGGWQLDDTFHTGRSQCRFIPSLRLTHRSMRDSIRSGCQLFCECSNTNVALS